LKEGNVHISAPHIYGSVLEALELSPNAPLSFLNIGSGTGYLTCIVAEILGPTSTHYGVEVHADVLEHSRSAIEEWKASRASSQEMPPIELIHGNGLQIDGTLGQCRVGLDRIYIGAAVEKHDLCQLASLLKPGGILVGPGKDTLGRSDSPHSVRSSSHPPCVEYHGIGS
jgi:protein-L-isoaspartate O-methyltransferase